MSERPVYSEEYKKYLEDFLLDLRKQFSSEEKYKDYIANIFLVGARELFGRMLSFLCEKSLLSQREIGRRSTQYRKEIKESGRLLAESSTGAVNQSGISRVISTERPPLYGQVFIWFHVLKERFESKEYAKECEELQEPIFKFTQEFEDDMWHAAGYAAPHEVVVVHESHKDLVY